MRCMKISRWLAAASAASLMCLAWPAGAQPPAAQVLAEMGWSADDQQKVLSGQFVTNDAPQASDKDLSLTIAFMVKTSPDNLSQQILKGIILGTDPQVKASGEFAGAGSLADLARLQISDDTARAFTEARPNGALNLSAAEIAAFNALRGSGTPAVVDRLRQMLLDRFQAYRQSGLAGIAPYDRGGGKTTDVSGELRKASTALAELPKYLPSLQRALIDSSYAAVPGLQQVFRWVHYNIDGTETFVLIHELTAADGAARVVVQRQYYVSGGYNAEQAVAGFLPVQGGTVVAYTNHTFTDQVAGFGGGVKRGIGRRVMAGKLKDIFETARRQVSQP